MNMVWEKFGGCGHCDGCGCLVTVRKYGPPYGDCVLCVKCDLDARLEIEQIREATEPIQMRAWKIK